MQKTRPTKRILRVDEEVDFLSQHSYRAHGAGFSLIELLAVLSLISLLAAIAVPRYLGLRDRAYVSTMRGDLYHLRLMQELHRRAGQRPYVGDVSHLGETFRMSPDVQITILSADAEGYTASATHTRTRQVCVYRTDDANTSCAPGQAPNRPPDPDESRTIAPADSMVGTR